MNRLFCLVNEHPETLACGGFMKKMGKKHIAYTIAIVNNQKAIKISLK